MEHTGVALALQSQTRLLGKTLSHGSFGPVLSKGRKMKITEGRPRGQITLFPPSFWMMGDTIPLWDLVEFLPFF